VGLRRSARRAPLPTGIPEVDAVIGGVPRGAITEIVGREGAGRTSVLLRLLASATSGGETCAYVDTGDVFDPAGAAASGVALSQVVWVRCGGEVSHALRAADYFVQAGGFGLVALDLGAVPPRRLGNIRTPYWHRFRLAVGETPTVLAVLSAEAVARGCSRARLLVRQKRRLWSGEQGGRLFRGIDFEISALKPDPGGAVTVTASPHLW